MGDRYNASDLIPKHGGYRKLKSFQIAQLVYDMTVRFCELYIDRRSRTHDQMVQAARSGVQNIAEGSQASGTSKKTELKLTNVSRASLEELRLDYEDFLRQRGLAELGSEDPVLKRFKARRCKTLDDIRAWVENEKALNKKHTDSHRRSQTDTETQTNTECSKASVSVSESPCESVSSSALVANAALSLLNLCCYFLDRQIEAQASDFEKNGGFTERLYRVRTARKKQK
jgi:four helix bundle suffix protein